MDGPVVDPGPRLPRAAGMCLPDLREDLPAGDAAVLAAVLDDVDVADAPGMDLLARAVGWERVVAMARAAQARVVGELVARPGVGSARVADELQAALMCTAYQAQRMVVRAQGLAAYPVLAEALGTGEVDLRRVDAVLDGLPGPVTSGRWGGVVAAVVEDAPSWSPPMVRRQTARLVLAADPEQARVRCERARRERCVRLDVAEDGMAWLSAFLPAPEAVAAFTVVDALAGSSQRDDDDRGVEQRRADAFAGIFTSIADTGVLPDGSALPRGRGRRARVQVTVAATTLLGLDDLPGELAGYGPVPADMARAIARDGTWRRLLTDPATGALVERGSTAYRPGADLTAAVVARDVTCTFMGCGQPAWRCELDHRTPFDPNRRADEQTVADNLDARCKHHHECKTHGGWTVRRDRRTGASEWTDPFGVTFTRLAVPLTITASAMAHLRGDAAAVPGGASDAAPVSPRRGTAVSGGATGPPGPARGYPDEPPF